MGTKLTYNEIEQDLREKGFTAQEIDRLTDWWRRNWDWLYTASAEEIRSASADCLE